jgi:DivIVA domain-containing protein
MTGTERPFRVKLHGYDQNQVDKLVDRVQNTLAGAIARDAVSVVELQYGVYFDIRMRGYDRRQVQQFIDDSINALRRKALAA